MFSNLRIIYTMTTINLSPTTVGIRLTRLEKLLGLARDLEVPVDAVRSARVVPDGIAAARGLRAPGLGIPGYRLIGTWRGRRSKALVSVRGRRPALLLEIVGQRFDRVLVTVEEPQEYVDQLTRLGVA